MTRAAKPGDRLTAKTLNRVMATGLASRRSVGGEIASPSGRVPVAVRKTDYSVASEHPFRVEYGRPDEGGNVLYVRGGAVIIDGGRCKPADIGTDEGDSLRTLHPLDDTADPVSIEVWANTVYTTGVVSFAQAKDPAADHSMKIADVDATGRVVQHVVGDVEARRAPWTLAPDTSDKTVRIFRGRYRYHGTELTRLGFDVGQWLDTGISYDVGGSSITIYLVVYESFGDEAKHLAYQSSSSADTDTYPADDYALVSAIAVGAVYTADGTVAAQYLKSDIVDDDQLLKAVWPVEIKRRTGEGAEDIEDSDYDGGGPREIGLDIDIPQTPGSGTAGAYDFSGSDLVGKTAIQNAVGALEGRLQDAIDKLVAAGIFV